MSEYSELTAMLFLETFFSLRNVLKYEIHDQKHNMTMINFNILGVLNVNESLPMKEIAALLNIKRSNLTKYIDQLLTHDFVVRKTSATDRRLILIYLTEKGREIYSKYRHLFMKCLGKKFEFFSEDEIKKLNDALITISVLMQRFREQGEQVCTI